MILKKVNSYIYFIRTKAYFNKEINYIYMLKKIKKFPRCYKL